MKVSILSLAILMFSCTSSVRLNSVDYGTLFNDGNSKVWLINKVVFKDAVVSSINNKEKDLLIFYSNGNCEQIAMKNITRKQPKKAKYHLNSRGHKIRFEFIDYTSEYKLSYLTEDSILMIPTSKSDTEFSLQIIPFQEL